jgi:hypothetical protein
VHDRNRTVLLSQRPSGKLDTGHFTHVDAPMPRMVMATQTLEVIDVARLLVRSIRLRDGN